MVPRDTLPGTFTHFYTFLAMLTSEGFSYKEMVWNDSW